MVGRKRVSNRTRDDRKAPPMGGGSVSGQQDAAPGSPLKRSVPGPQASAAASSSKRSKTNREKKPPAVPRAASPVVEEAPVVEEIPGQDEQKSKAPVQEDKAGGRE